MDYVDDYMMVQNLIPKSLCRSLIKDIENGDWSQHSWYDSNTDEKTTMAEKELSTLGATHEQFQQLSQHIGEAIQNYQNKYSTPGEKTGDSWIRQISRSRFNRYSVGTKMRAHYDHIQSIFDGTVKGVPILSILGLLNDNFEGAEFICRGKEIKLVRGDILIFPSNFMFPHEVKETTKGVRYSVVSWAF